MRNGEEEVFGFWLNRHRTGKLTKSRKTEVVLAFPEAGHFHMLAGLTTEGDTGMQVTT